MKCLICGTEPTTFSWTDTHKVATCFRCGAPYDLRHSPADLAIKEDKVELCRAYWQETKQKIPGQAWYAFMRPDSVRDRNDHTAFHAWEDAREASAAEVEAE